ncbi:CBF1-interacting co-repressor CIR [Macleaya cordata]|uniref:CBF1-interacting co-repressor CIR n=1 Tax=Macleaya cordata TaxID=56857 RepID=A0A200QXV5_MACCD|nr:CBF1-interacting co-repressor CIR [Macleaya cordata]
MGGHGGLNILPQKRWNVYNYENREKVRKDEEAAAKEEQLKREQSRKRDSEFRLEKLRLAKGLPSTTSGAEASTATASEPKTNHINLFEGLKFFPSLGGAKEEEDGQREGMKMNKRLKKEEAAPKVVLPEDEKYRLGYGVAGKGVKAPWYLSKPSNDEKSGDSTPSESGKREGGKNSGKKTLEELREERLKRERREKERERALLLEKNNKKYGAAPKVRGFSRHGM